MKTEKLTKEELKFTIGQITHLFKGEWRNGNFKEYTEYTYNSEKSFDKDVILLKSIIKKLKKELKKKK